MDATTRDRYGELLAQIYAFEAPIEAALLAQPDIDRELVRGHIKCHRLADDLAQLRISARELAPVERLQLADGAEALGWLYVLDRNTLLHGLVLRYLVDLAPEVVHGAGRYLSAFEGRAGRMQRELSDALEAAAARPGTAERIVSAANEAFRAQRQWYRAPLPVKRAAAPRRVA